MAKDGIHAALLVLSVRTRFSKEEEAAIQSLQNFFGSKINDYMIVVFTGGDELEDDETLEDYLGRECPEPLKKILLLCENRRVLFDNKTKDVKKKTKQVQELLSLVDAVLAKNGRKPYTHDIFVEMKNGGALSMEGHPEDKHTSNEEQLKRITEMVESKLRETTRRLEQQLVEEQAARLKVEENAQAAQVKSNNEIHELRGNLQKTQREMVELRNPPARPQTYVD
ncbi:hypothetical protein LguiA_029111 [Lonicera macranthoides]